MTYQEWVTEAITIFNQSIADYHLHDNVDHPIQNPYEADTIQHTLYQKNAIDSIQWHLEDIIRNPNIDPAEALTIKRRIDKLNQERTDIVEQIDDFFIDQFQRIQLVPQAPINTESPAWAIDRLSILQLKRYHMQEELERKDVDQQHLDQCQAKANLLEDQQNDMIQSISHLLNEMSQGQRQMKVYRQVKMYNDPNLNPVLYKK